MIRVGVVLSALVAIGWFLLAIAALRSEDDLAGVAVLFLMVYASAALVLVWFGVWFASIIRRIVRGAREARRDSGLTTQVSPA